MVEPCSIPLRQHTCVVCVCRVLGIGLGWLCVGCVRSAASGRLVAACLWCNRAGQAQAFYQTSGRAVTKNGAVGQRSSFGNGKNLVLRKAALSSSVSASRAF